MKPSDMNANSGSSMPTATTTVAQAASASRAARRANLRQNRERAQARPSSPTMTAGSSRNEDSASSLQWALQLDDSSSSSSSAGATARDDEIFVPLPSIPLTEMLPLIQLPYRPRHGMEAIRGRPLTNADIIATIDEVLDLVGGDDIDHLEPIGNPPGLR